MFDVLTYVATEVKSGRLQKSDAIHLFDLMRRARRGHGEVAVLHPLLQRNTSDLDEQRFSSTLSGEEFYLSDHVVNGTKVLPGVAYLEMARAAVERSAGMMRDGSTRVVLENVVWMRPVAVSEAKEVHIELSASERNEIEFEIYSVVSDEETVTHAQGRAVFREAGASATADRIDLTLLGSQCTQSIEVAQCYAIFSAMGIEYGAAHRGLTSVQVGRDVEGRRFVLAQVKLPECVSETQEQYVLHPSVLDSALQASIGMSLAELDLSVSGARARPVLPFALEQLEVLDRSPLIATVVVRSSMGYSAGSSAGSGIQKLDIELCDESGRVCVRLRGFTSRVLEGEQAQAGGGVSSAEAGVKQQTLLLMPSWKAKPLEAGSIAVEYGERWVLVDSIYKECLPELEAHSESMKWTVLGGSGEGLAGEQVLGAGQQVFAQVQRILQGKSTQRQRVLLQVLIGTELESGEITTALSGFLKSAQQENPELVCQVIELPRAATVSELRNAVEENASEAAKHDQEIRYLSGVREVAHFKELGSPSMAKPLAGLPWKNGGVYLITGGAGGLGLIFAREIANQVEDARIILTGRSELSATKQALLEGLQQEVAGARIEYRVMDVSDANAVTMCVHSLVEQYGVLNGIIHGAGVIQDNFIIKKTPAEFAEVLAPKVTGTLNLDRATHAMPLDFLFLFSSLAGVLGNVGQSDYALGNAFMDGYARYRNQLVQQKQRHGKTLSINWPLWAEGGMGIEEETRAAMRRHGFDVLTNAEGIDALYRAWGSSASQVVVLVGDRQKLKQLLGLTTMSVATVSKQEVAVETSQRGGTVSRGELQDKTLQYLKKLLSGALKLPVDRIESDVGLERYGIDSIMALKLVNELEAAFGSLPKTLMFEYQSIDALAEYFIERHREALIAHLKLTERALVTARPLTSVVSKEALAISVGAKRRRGRFAMTPALQRDAEQANTASDIAIIGISGRYPGAKNVSEFWENLKAGKDCITEVPPDRWDHSQYFDPEKGKLGKSYSKWGGFVDGVAEFDPLFFNISPREALFMDPQERLFLQCVYQTLEDAGYTRETLKFFRTRELESSVGVFVGVMYEEYQLYGAQAQALGQPYALGGNPSTIANRVSYFCNLHGPSMAVDTMCSSSLTAIHLACESIKHRGCEVAIAGGVNVSIHPNKYLALSQGQFASSNGRCESFGIGGDGYVPGEGVGAVLLKSLTQAIADHDHIYGVIKSTSINHGGKTNGYTVPNPVAQAQLIETALHKANIDARAVSYIEAHGTGTSLGDPIEIAGLTRAFSAHTSDTQYCAIGSAKSNIGHLESAAGIAALTKVLLQMRHRTLVPSLHSEVLNPHIDFARTPFKVQQSLSEWQRPVIEINGAQREYPRIAGISSFGAGGANAHVIIEEYVEQPEEWGGMEVMPEHPALMVLSAKTEERLQEQARQLLSHIERQGYSRNDLSAIAYTLQIGREAMEHRLAFTATTVDELQAKLTGYLEGKVENGGIEDCYLGQVKRDKETLSLFTADEELQEAIGKWIQRGKYTKLLELWVKGLAFDWNRLYVEGKPRRISLPTYPFARERYWVGPSSLVPQRSVLDTEEQERVDEESSDVDESKEEWIEEAQREVFTRLTAREPREAIERLVFTEAWQESAVAIAKQSKVRTVVAMLSGAEHQNNLLAAMAQIDAQSTLVFMEHAGTDASDELSSSSLSRYRVEGESVESLQNTFNRIVAAHGSIDAVWYLWGVEDAIGIEDQRPVVRLLQGLSRAGIKATKVLLAGEFRTALAHCHMESWIGYERSMKLVLPDVQLAVIQAEQPVAQDEQTSSGLGIDAVGITSWAHRLWDESRGERIESALYRAGQRHVLRLQPMEVTSKGGSGLRAGGTYLITGGLGGLGYLVASHLASRYSAKLILTGRSDMAAAKQSKLDALTALGGQAQYFAADVSDVEQMRVAIIEGEKLFGELQGVIHAAGVDSETSILEKDTSSIESVLSPKIAGTVVLSALLQNHALDFICYFSSISAVLGDFGSCDYAVGNRFEVAHAQYVERKALAICWPLWADGGMGLGDEAATQLYLKSSGQRALETQAGIELFERLLSHRESKPLSHAMVMVGERSRINRMLGLVVGSSEPRLLRVRSERNRPELRGLTTGERVVWELKELASELLGLPRGKLDADENLGEFGFDSIGLATFAKRLSQQLEIELLPSVFFSHATLAKLAEYLQVEHAAAIERHYGEEVKARPRSAARAAVPIVRSSRSHSLGQRLSTTSKPSGALQNTDSPEPIAIIGMSGRFPGARSIDELWQVLVEGRSTVDEIPLSRFDWRGVYQEQKVDQSGMTSSVGKTTSKWLGVLPGVEEFDPLFFEISPREAELMDPRQRLLLQESYRALEDAGYGARQLSAHKIGMFVGVEQGDYQVLLSARGAEGGVTANHDAILAARLSYCLDLRGPAMAINTACSSGLVAAHQACQSVRTGESDAAIAAGVNLILTPHSYVAMSQAGMLSPEGKCYAFDRRANGMVPGEAVVAIVVKRLAQAQADGDVIYAVIRGSGINYDGKTNGLTAPSGAAQAELIHEVHARAQVRPEEIEYIVTHGTGTRLGDPVEINALREVFKESQHTAPYCALTSTKTNVGHTFAASGLVSLISLVQALREETIPASLYCEQLSDYIDWQRSPFYVNTQNKAWPKRPKRPRLGAVSAFGMSGTNAHLVVASYDQAAVSSLADRVEPYYLLAISAKTDVALQQRVRDLLSVLNDERRRWDAESLCGLSDTLLNHRQHFTHRCAVVIAEREQAVALLEKIESGEKLPTVLRGKVARDFVAQPALKSYAADLMEKLSLQPSELQGYRESLMALGDLYCQGYQLNWSALYGADSPPRISLPTYPFARERYWVEQPGQQSGQSKAGTVTALSAAAVLHPLLQRNTSDLDEQRFSSTLSGEEFYLSDHVVNGTKVLPGVAYLEMARAAVERSAGMMRDGSTRVVLENVVWMRPVAVSEAKEVHIELSASERNEIEFEIYSVVSDEETVTHAQGRAVFREAGASATADRIDLTLLGSQCTQSIEVAQCYAIFSAMGIEYGAAHRGLTSVQVGRDVEGRRFVLAQVKLPECVSETQEQYVLHPSVLDSALQASIGMSLAELDLSVSGARARPVLPFALEQLEVLDRSPLIATVVVRSSMGYSAGSSAGSGIQKLDIELCDESGRVCVRLRGFTSRVLEGEQAQAGGGVSSAEAGVKQQTLLLMPSWKAKPLEAGSIAVEYGERWVLVDSIYKECLPELEAHSESMKWTVLGGSGEGLAGEQVLGAGQQVFAQVQRILQGKSTQRQRVLLQVLIGTELESGEITTALSGFLKSAQQENPELVCQVIELPRAATVSELRNAVEENASEAAKHDQEIRYLSGVREVAHFKELGSPSMAKPLAGLPWKNGGVYLITGGAGGLGLIFAREIANQVEDARIILTGRSELSATKQALLEGLQQEVAGARIEYRVMDVSDANAVTMCVHSLVEQYGVLNGIIHGAGVIQDNFIIKKTPAEFAEVLAPKVTGTLNLDRATHAMPLDFLFLFSSLAGVLGNVGQSDYALGNAFMDGYARYRNQLVQQKQRHGKTLSINWPLWAEGGMGIEEETRAAMRRHGFDVLTNAEGIDALYRAWGSSASQVVVLVGDRQKLKQLLGLTTMSVATVSKQEVAVETSQRGGTVSRGELQDKTLQYLKKLLSGALKLPVDRIESDVGLERYGIDSIMALKLVNELEAAFGSLPKTLMFEYQSIDALAEYFIERHREALIAHLKLTERALVTARPLTSVVSKEALAISVGAKRRRGRFAMTPALQRDAEQANTASDIAIIGISGRYPGAKNVSEFWENLKAGKDCITEVPPDRWDHSQYFDPENTKLGKTSCKWGGFIKGIDTFDNSFFNIPNEVAQVMDPQERVLMEVVWHLMENAGYTSHHIQARHQGSIGVYVGAHAFIESGASTAWLASRVTAFYNLNGPSFVVDTFSASSVTGLHLACEGLVSGDCQLAIVAGVCVLHPEAFIDGGGRFLSTREDRRGFSTGGGIIFSEGVGAVLVKPLSAAIQDSDQILAVIKSTALNSAGKPKGSFPTDPAIQATVIRSSLEKAGIHPRTIGSIDPPITGATVADFAEIQAYTKIFRDSTADTRFCVLGSVESTMGHAIAAGGMAQLTKAILQLRHGQFVPTIKMDPINPDLDLVNGPFFLQRSLVEWPRAESYGQSSETPRRGMITSRGVDGTQVAVVLEEYRQSSDVTMTSENENSPDVVVMLSARTKDQLRLLAEDYMAHIKSEPTIDLLDLAYTLGFRRTAMRHRLAIVASSLVELLERLTEYVETPASAEMLSIEQGRTFVGEVRSGRTAVRELLDEDEEGRLIQMYVRENNAEKIAKYWTLGSDVQKVAFDQVVPRRLISLPGYPFAGSRFLKASSAKRAQIHDKMLSGTLLPAGELES